MTIPKTSVIFIVIGTLLEHNKANATVTAASVGVVATLSTFAEDINSILQMSVSLVTIIVAATTTYIAVQNFKERKKKDDKGDD